MKSNKIIIKSLIGFIILIFVSSCDEDAFLEEKPLDFLTTDTAYETFEQFESALVELYARVRLNTFGNPGGNRQHYTMSQWTGTDVFKDGRFDPGTFTRFGSYSVSYNPTHPFVSFVWSTFYKIISNSNTILSRLEASDLTAEEKALIGAEAKFFRAFAYRYLVYHYGGVPLVVEEINTPKSDFQRASKTEILNQMVQDFSDAVSGLKGISEVEDGRLHKLVAQHFLAETYVALENWDAAISAASAVIDDPNTALMTERFGSLSTDPEGDVYWDLFRVGNQNRASGNTEAIWVCQMETDVQGGLISSGSAGQNHFERHHGSLTWTLTDPDGNPGTLGPRSTTNIGGRGINWIGLTIWFYKDIWGDDFEIDIRSQPSNLYQSQFYDNPASPYFGQSVWDPISPTLVSTPFRVQPYLTKVTTPKQHPDNLYSNSETGQLKSSAGGTFRDQYYLRLAETYLLRAEAYLGKGDTDNAAIDINKVRSRSNASDVSAGDVTLDYILDERGRELSFEEPRRLHLHRTGKLVERVRLYNTFNSDDISDHNNLMPIPLGDIESNVTGNLEQNPDYD